MGAINAASQPVRPAAPRQATPAPAATPVAQPKADQFVRQGAQTFNFPGLAAGQRLDVKGKFQGHGFGGKSTINQFDGKTLDFTVNASAMLGLIRVKVHLRLEANPDGTVNFIGERVKDKNEKVDPNTPEKAGAKLKVLANRPGMAIFEAPDGQKVTLASLPNGGLQIAYDKYQIAMKP